MRLTIIADDNLVIVDGRPLRVDLSFLHPAIHAVQWYGEAGEVEFKTIDGARAPNEVIKDVTPFQRAADLHAQALVEAEADMTSAQVIPNVVSAIEGPK